MKISLKFTKSVCILLELIIDNYQKFYDFYKEEEIIYKKNLNYGIKSKIPKIDVEEIATPDKNDNMKKSHTNMKCNFITRFFKMICVRVSYKKRENS